VGVNKSDHIVGLESRPNWSELWVFKTKAAARRPDNNATNPWQRRHAVHFTLRRGWILERQCAKTIQSTVAIGMDLA
jgi:hypothetical protein